MTAPGQRVSARFDPEAGFALSPAIPAEARAVLARFPVDAQALSVELLRRIDANDLPVPVAAACVSHAWIRAAPRPLRIVPEEEWRRLWAAAGFCVDGRPAAPPTEPLLLFRGAPEAQARRWCWTDDPRIGVMYGTSGGRTRWEYASANMLWATLAPVGALRASLPAATTSAAVVAREWVVDPAELADVRPWTAEEIDAAPRPSEVVVAVNGQPGLRLSDSEQALAVARQQAYRAAVKRSATENLRRAHATRRPRSWRGW